MSESYPPHPNRSAQEQIRRMLVQIDEVIHELRNWRAMLRDRHVSLSPDVLDNLHLLRNEINMMEGTLAESLRELHQLRSLAGTTSLINSAQETHVVLNQVMDTVIHLTGAERGYIVLRNRDTGELNQFAVARGIDEAVLRTASQSDYGGRGPHDFIVSRTIVQEVLRSGEPIHTENASQDRRFRDQASIVGHALRSILAVPLKVRDDIIGVVYCDNRAQAGLFHEHDLDMLAAFADQAAASIDNAYLFENARARLAQMTDMRDLMNNIFDSIANGVITLNIEGTITTCNAAACRMLGNQSPVGEYHEDVLPLLDRAYHEALNDVRYDGTARLVRTEPHLPGMGWRFWTVTISALYDASGEYDGLALVLDDLTERHTREKQLAELRHYLPSALVEHFRAAADVESGQEREITVMTADVRGFTSVSEHLPPELLMETINKYLSLASDAVDLYQGIVDKYRGDAVIGLFNTQLNPQEDHTARAVRTALSIMHELAGLHAQMPPERRLIFGIGIHTGPAYLGNVGGPERKDFSALGEAMTISKLLESCAQPGEVLISAAAYELVQQDFECVEHIPEKVTDQPLDTIYRVIRRRSDSRISGLFSNAKATRTRHHETD